MPERKKPGSSRSAAKPSSGLRRPPRRATKIGRASGTGRAAQPARKKAAPRRVLRTRKPAKPATERRAPAVVDHDDDRPQKWLEPVEATKEETPVAGPPAADVRPVAIAGITQASEPPALGAVFPGAPGLADPGTEAGAGQPEPEPDRSERYPQDVLVAILSALLAATAFVPWYRLQGGTQSTGVTGWESGTWGPVVFFLALGSLALSVTRLIGVRVSLPLPHPTIHEGVGWIAIFAVLLKRLLRPASAGSFAGTIGQTWWILAPIAAGLALAFISGRMTSGPPLVVIPGWHRGRAGLIGIVLAMVVVAGGAAVGKINSGNLEQTLADKRNSQIGGSGGGPSQLKPIVGKFPKCAAGFPRPEGADPQRAVEQTARGPCVFTFHVSGKPASVIEFYKTALPKNGITAEVVLDNAQASAMSMRGARCGNISVTNRPDGAGSLVAVATQPCPTNPTPRASTSPK